MVMRDGTVYFLDECDEIADVAETICKIAGRMLDIAEAGKGRLADVLRAELSQVQGDVEPV